MPTTASREIDTRPDALARALCRAEFLVELANAAATERGAASTVLFLVDVDRLRNVNDRHGQAVGDAVLRETAERIAAALREPDWSMHEGLLARFDGDGFMVMLRWCRLSFTEQLAENLRQRIVRAPFAKGLRVSVSIAVAAHRRGESIDALLARTEKTLHLAKQFGGDRIEIARTPEPRERRAEPISIDFLRA
jgi:diguanylate cyclase (GGDEF)-like protein